MTNKLDSRISKVVRMTFQLHYFCTGQRSRSSLLNLIVIIDRRASPRKKRRTLWHLSARDRVMKLSFDGMNTLQQIGQNVVGKRVITIGPRSAP